MRKRAPGSLLSTLYNRETTSYRGVTARKRFSRYILSQPGIFPDESRWWHVVSRFRSSWTNSWTRDFKSRYSLPVETRLKSRVRLDRIVKLLKEHHSSLSKGRYMPVSNRRLGPAADTVLCLSRARTCHSLLFPQRFSLLVKMSRPRRNRRIWKLSDAARTQAGASLLRVSGHRHVHRFGKARFKLAVPLTTFLGEIGRWLIFVPTRDVNGFRRADLINASVVRTLMFEIAFYLLLPMVFFLSAPNQYRHLLYREPDA